MKKYHIVERFQQLTQMSGRSLQQPNFSFQGNIIVLFEKWTDEGTEKHDLFVRLQKKHNRTQSHLESDISSYVEELEAKMESEQIKRSGSVFDKMTSRLLSIYKTVSLASGTFFKPTFNNAANPHINFF